MRIDSKLMGSLRELPISKRAYKFSLFVLCAIVITFNASFLKSAIVGCIFFAIYLYLLIRTAYIEKEVGPLSGFLFFVVLLLLFTTPIFVLRIPFFDIMILPILLIPSLLTLQKDRSNEINTKTKKYTLNINLSGIAIIGFFSTLIIILFSILSSVRTGETVLSPREVFPSSLHVYIFLVSFCVILLLFSKHSVEIRFSVVAAYSLAISSFMYMVYELMFGSDLWTYLAIERWIYDYNPLPRRPTLLKILADGLNNNIGLSGINVILSKILQIELYWVTLLFGALLASVFIPIVLYEIGKKVYDNAIYALLLSFLPSFLLETLIWRSISSSNGFGLLIFLFSLLVWIRYLVNNQAGLFLPVMTTIGSILAYPLMGIFSVSVAMMTVFLKKYGMRNVPGMLSMVLIAGSIFPIMLLTTGTAGLANLKALDEVLVRLVLPSHRANWYMLLDLPYIFLYYLAILGIFRGRKKLKSEVYALLMALFVIVAWSALFGDLTNFFTLRVHSTVYPYFLIIFGGLGIESLVQYISRSCVRTSGMEAKMFVVHQRFSGVRYFVPMPSKRFQTLKNSLKGNSLTKSKLFTIAISFTLALGPFISYAYMPTLGPSLSRSQHEAINYLLNDNKTQTSLVLADDLTLTVLSAESRGRWYDHPSGECLYALRLTFPIYWKMMQSPSYEALVEAKETVETYFWETYGKNMTVNHAYVVVADIEKFYRLKLEEVVGRLSTLMGKPKSFGNVFVYSSSIPQQYDKGWMIPLTDDVEMYNVIFNDFEELMEEANTTGEVIYFPRNRAIVMCNGSLSIRIKTEHQIINASVSASICRYEEDDVVGIQVSTDYRRWTTAWETKTTKNYTDLVDLSLPLTYGQDSLYIRFYGEKYGKEPYSAAIRNLQNNLLNGIMVKLYLHVSDY